MSFLAWDKFIKSHEKKYAFTVAIPTIKIRNTGKGKNKTKVNTVKLEFDKNGLSLPSALDMFKKWLMSNMTGCWTARKISGGFFCMRGYFE